MTLSRLMQPVWWLIAAAAWVAFGYAWYVVLRDGMPDILNSIGFDLGFIAVTLGVFTAYWIVRNVRIAREGHRGGATRWTPLSYEEDPLGQPVRRAEGVGDARVVAVTVDEAGHKHLRPGEGAA